MRRSGKCPKCGGKRLWVVDPIAQPDGDSSNQVHAMRVATRRLALAGGALTFGQTWERAAVGFFVAYVCEGCGFSEMYARDIEDLADLEDTVPHDAHGDPGSNVELLDTQPPKDGPHR